MSEKERAVSLIFCKNAHTEKWKNRAGKNNNYQIAEMAWIIKKRKDFCPSGTIIV